MKQSGGGFHHSDSVDEQKSAVHFNHVFTKHLVEVSQNKTNWTVYSLETFVMPLKHVLI